MKAIIPVAGVGTRLRPHTFSHPKVLLNVAGKPIIGHIMDKLIDAGIDEAIVIVGYLGNMIEEWLVKHYNIKFTFVTQTEILGLAHAVWMCKPYVIDNEPLFIILGDTIFDVNLEPVLKSPCSTLGVKEVEDPRRFGVAVTDGNEILKLVEKPDTPVSNLAIVGLYFIKKAGSLFASVDYLIDNEIKTKGEFQLTDALQLLIDSGMKIRTKVIEHWLDCGTRDAMLETNRYLLAQEKLLPEASVVRIADVPDPPANSAMTAPASAGPMNRLACAVPCTAVFPSDRSSLRTMRGTIAVCAGKKNASAIPNERANA